MSPSLPSELESPVSVQRTRLLLSPMSPLLSCVVRAVSTVSVYKALPTAGGGGDAVGGCFVALVLAASMHVRLGREVSVRFNGTSCVRSWAYW